MISKQDMTNENDVINEQSMTNENQQKCCKAKGKN